MSFTESTTSFAERLKEVTSKEITAYRSELENLVNNFSFDAKKTVEALEQTENDRVMTFIKVFANKWIIYWSQPGRWVDGRNEYSTAMCKEIAAADFTTCEDYLPTIDILISEIGQRTHRTLVQSISSLVFYIIARYDKKINDVMSQRYDSRWWQMPMI